MQASPQDPACRNTYRLYKITLESLFSFIGIVKNATTDNVYELVGGQKLKNGFVVAILADIKEGRWVRNADETELTPISEFTNSLAGNNCQVDAESLEKVLGKSELRDEL